MAFLLNANWSWQAAKFLFERHQEMSRVRKQGIVVVVTGATGGLGLATVKALCQRLSQIPSHQSHSVILTSRNDSKGRWAVKHVRHPTVQVGFHQLEPSDANSIATFRDDLSAKFGQIDVLINNASILPLATEFDERIEAKQVMAVNYYATKAVIAALMPLMAPGGRVVTAASSLAELAIRWMNDETYTKMFSVASTEKDIDSAVESFVKEISAVNKKPNRFSNVLVHPFAQAARIAITQHLGDKAQSGSRGAPKDVILCTFSPGWCRTLSGGPRAPFSAMQGAEEAVYAALDAKAEEIQGCFLVARKPSRFGDAISVHDIDLLEDAHDEQNEKAHDDPNEISAKILSEA